MNGFAQVGIDVRVYGAAKIIGPERVSVGSHVIIDDFVFIGAHAKLEIGNHVHIASHASITGGGECLIADFAGISSGARVLTGTDSFAGDSLTGPTIPADLRKVHRGRVVIGSHAVIGANAVILPDVTVGEGAAIGAGAVLTRDAKPWTIYAGVPARAVRERPRELMLREEARLYELHGRPATSFRFPPEGAR